MFNEEESIVLIDKSVEERIELSVKNQSKMNHLKRTTDINFYSFTRKKRREMFFQSSSSSFSLDVVATTSANDCFSSLRRRSRVNSPIARAVRFSSRFNFFSTSLFKSQSGFLGANDIRSTSSVIEPTFVFFSFNCSSI